MTALVVAELARREALPRTPADPATDLLFDIADVGCAGSITAVPRKIDGRFRDLSNLPLGLGPFGSSISTTRDEVLAELEDRYLTPRPFFSEKWLNRLQGTVERDPDYLSLLALDPSKPSSVINVVRSGVEGEVTGYREEPLAETSMTAKNSTSLQREPGTRADFVRGRSGFYPFAPGGLESAVLVPEEDSVQTVAREIEQSLNFDDEGLLTIPPGFERGLISHDGEIEREKVQGGSGPSEVLNIKNILSEEGAFDFTAFDEEDEEEERDEDQMTTPTMESKEFDKSDVDALLPETPVALATASPKRKPAGATAKRDWAHVVDVNEDFPDFRELVPDMAHEYPFELDIFQKRAVYHLEKGESVFVAAHTSAGKTVVAEYAIALAQRHMTRAIYTSPIKALSNQKFRDFRTTFEDVGILTGDVQIRPEASCLIMTTEILRSMLYRGADLIRDVEFVIFDEVHYVNDTERGVVWEEVIIMLPAHVSLILLSATVPNTKEFADWVGRTKKKNIYVISTPKRPVPLEHYLFAGNEMHKIVDARKNFLSVGWKNANDAYSSSQKKENTGSASGARDGRGGARGGGRGFSRGGDAAGSNRVSASGGKNGGRSFATDRNQWINVVTLLRKKNLLPVVIFTFSKRKCEEYAGGLNSIDLTTSSEKSEVHVFIEKSLMRLIGTDRELPQVLRMRDLLSRGIAVHHGGLLPIIKEMVEILFARGLVKVLFATETFAMGVNMPARTCVFSGTRKHDGRSFRDLLPGEYTQMSGRAGRRGLDDTGVVIIAFQDRDGIPEVSLLNTMILGTPTKLESQFRLTYNMILNLLRVEALRVEEMIKRSFSENTSQRALPEKQKLFAESEKSLNTMQKLNCGICIDDIENFFDCSARVLDLARKMHEKVLVSNLAQRALNQGRIVVINNQFYRNSAAVILRPVAGSKSVGAVRRTGGGERILDDKLFWCMILCDKKATALPDAVDGLAPLPVTQIHVPDSTTCTHEITSFSVADMAIITRTSIKIDAEAIFDRKDEYETSGVVRQLRKFAADSQTAGIIEHDWSKFKELEFQDMCKEKQTLMESLNQYQCTKCPDLTEHYALVHEERTVRGKIAELQHIISDQNLELLPDYHQRVEVLKILNYIDSNSTVQLKGRVAAEVSTADELILTELILENTLAEFEPSEIVALLSCFVFQERKSSAPNLTPRLTKGMKIILDIAARVADVQASCGLPVRVDDYKDSLKFGLVEVVYEWAQGMPFKGITGLTDVLEGSIVRCIVRLDETCREVRSAARMIGDAALYKKMEEAQLAIKRDIVFAASLYFN